MPHGSTIHHGFVTRHGQTSAHGYVGLHGSLLTEDDVFSNPVTPPDADALAYIARMATVPTAEQADAYDYFVKQAKLIGVWPYITDCGFLCAQDAISARLGVKNAINLTLVGTAPTHVPGYGTKGNGSSQAFNTTYKFPAGQQNNAHLGAYSYSDIGSDNAIIGNANAAIVPRRQLGSGSFHRVNGSAAGAGTSLDGLGFFIANRTGALATEDKLYRRGVEIAASSSASVAPDTVYDIWVCGRNGSLLQYSERMVSFWSIGQAIPAGMLVAYSLLVEEVCARLATSYTVATVTTPTKNLYRYMTKMSRQPSFVLAAFDNTWWNLGTTPNLIADIATITGGKVPAMIGHEWADPLSIGGAAASAAQITRIKNHYAAGGIVTVHMHPGNPVTGSFEQLPTTPGTAGNQYDMTGAPVVACLTGGAKRTEFLAFVDRLIAFFQACTDASGNPIPIIFRPFHEINGGFFWWTDPTPANTIQLWRDMVDRIKAAGVQNILYNWSANFAPTPNTAYFPGLAYADFVSVDYYDNVASPVGLSGAATCFGALDQTGLMRPAYLGEMGYQGAADNDAGLWTVKVGRYHREQMSRSSGFMLWRSTFGPSAGGATNAEFASMVADASCITRDRLSSVYS